MVNVVIKMAKMDIREMIKQVKYLSYKLAYLRLISRNQSIEPDSVAHISDQNTPMKK